MKRALLIAALLWLWPSDALSAPAKFIRGTARPWMAPYFADILPASCVQSVVQTSVNGASNGDTIILPACAATNWTTTLTSTVSVMLQGQPCTTGSSGKTDALGNTITIATSCTTNIVDAMTGDTGPLIDIPVNPCAHPCSWQAGMRHIAFTSAGTRTYAYNSIFEFHADGAVVEDGRRVKLEYLRLVGLVCPACQLFQTSEWGVMTHVYIELPTDQNNIIIYHTTGGPSYNMPRVDLRTANSTIGGLEASFTIESNYINGLCSGTYAHNTRTVTDSHSSGSRFNVRRNYIYGLNVQQHGTEQGWMRGPNYIEGYQNRFYPCSVGQTAVHSEVRTGAALWWGNVDDAAFQTGTPAMHLKTYRMEGQFAAYNEVNGEPGLDVVDGANPLDTCTTSNAVRNAGSEGNTNNWVITCAGKNWTEDQWAEPLAYMLRQPFPACRERWNAACAAIIISNTTNTLTIAASIFDASDYPYGLRDSKTLNLNTTVFGDSLEIQGVTASFDSPCRTGGTMFGTTGTISGITYSGGTGLATFTGIQSMASMGIVDGDYVSIEAYNYSDAADYNNKPYRGTYQVDVTGTFTFTYTPRRVPAGSETYGGFFKKVVSDASVQGGGCYEWQNFNSANAAIHFSTGVPGGGIVHNARFMDLRVSGTDSNPVVFNWVGTSTTVGVQTSDISPFSGASGVGVGTLANRPMTCTTGVGYWVTNAGEWDNTNGATADGRFDKCVASAWVDGWYVPLAFPHPLASGVGGVSSVTPAVCTQGQTLNNAALAGVGFQGAGAAFAISGADVTLSDTNITSDTAATIDIACGASAAVGARSLYLSATAGTGYGATFTINGSADTTPPVVGGGGTITLLVPSSSAISASWTKATDVVTAQSALQYEVRRSLTNNLGSVANAEANGTICQNYTTDIATAACSGLTPATEYYVQVLVKDEAGNKQIYTQTNATTDAEPGSPPVVGGSGVLQTLNVTASTLDLVWFAGTDDDTPQHLLEYSIRRSASANIDTVANAEANGTLLLDYTPIAPDISGAIAIPIGGLAASTTYYFNVIVRDSEGEKAAYTMTNTTTTLSVGAGVRIRLRVR